MQFRGRHYSIKINTPTLAQLESSVKERLSTGKGFALATMNVDHLVKLSRSQDFAAAYAKHDLVVADGNPVVWVAKLGGDPVDLITGSDQVVPMTRWATETQTPIALVGSTNEALEKAAYYIEKVGLKDRLLHRVGELSGGERQRAAIARVLVRQPALVLCDEPTGSLDVESGISILDLLRDVTRDGERSVLIVTHNSVIADMADRVLRLRDGEIISDDIVAHPRAPEGLSW